MPEYNSPDGYRRNPEDGPAPKTRNERSADEAYDEYLDDQGDEQ